MEIHKLKDTPIPEATGITRKSAIPELLKQIKKGEYGIITNTFTETPEHKWKTTDQPKIATIRSYLIKHSKTYTNYTLEQRTKTEKNPLNETIKIVNLYIIHN